jgi:hypothetical protein
MKKTLAYTFLLGTALMLSGCTSTVSYWGDPAKSPYFADPKDEYECVRDSKQNLGGFELQSTVIRDAQRLYDLCVKGRGGVLRQGRS